MIEDEAVAGDLGVDHAARCDHRHIAGLRADMVMLDEYHVQPGQTLAEVMEDLDLRLNPAQEKGAWTLHSQGTDWLSPIEASTSWTLHSKLADVHFGICVPMDIGCKGHEIDDVRARVVRWDITQRLGAATQFAMFSEIEVGGRMYRTSFDGFSVRTYAG